MGFTPMPTPLKTAVLNYLRSGNLAKATHRTYRTTLRKWSEWGGDVPIEELTRQEIRDFLDWVHEQAISNEQSNPARTANKSRENLRAVMSWAWERDMVDVLPRFPKPRPHRRIAGRQYLTKSEINAVYFATHKMKRPRAWNNPIPIGRYWRAALVVFFNYGLSVVLGACAIAVCSFVAYGAGRIPLVFQLNTEFTGASRKLIDSVVTQLEAGNSDKVLADLKVLQPTVYENYEDYPRYTEIVDKFVAKLDVSELSDTVEKGQQ
jgi:hypothetical protein